MTDMLLAYEPWLRLGAFGGVFAAMAVWETGLPRRPLTIGRRRRWPSNLGVVALDTLVVRILFPTAAVGVALMAEARGWGLFNQLALPAGSILPSTCSTCCSTPCRCCGGCTACTMPISTST
jgi:hypothetical protein